MKMREVWSTFTFFWSLFVVLMNFALSCFWIGLKAKVEELKLFIAMIQQLRKK